MRIAKANKNYHIVECKGGPWDGKIARLPVKSKEDPWSLCICIGWWKGRYNFFSGEWKNE